MSPVIFADTYAHREEATKHGCWAWHSDHCLLSYTVNIYKELVKPKEIYNP